MASLGNSVVFRVDCRNCPREFSNGLGLGVLLPPPPPSLPLAKPSRVSFALSIPAALSTEIPPEGYRRNVGICLVNTSKEIFTGSRIRIPHTWQMPQGGADEGEDLRKAAMRELREETGVTSAEFLAEAPYWLTYDFPSQIRIKLNRRWGSNYKGQAQKWFLYKFTGKEEEINLLGDGSEKPEFNEWSWRLPEQLLEIAGDFRKPVYEQVFKVFSSYFSVDADEEDCLSGKETNGKEVLRK
ncbi:hypothetical protein SLEP1_g38669 [Rubroshorea leprosula]|uniref:Nudix hydrolase domain-containing protein n=1 Tax=Rubroshorea leprosula TaxID=152421 RepID=A0AAV5KYI7_9ROSI|nr:hypothetical protein SLEP1_g38669 [Rubroshorea leprosula]